MDGYKRTKSINGQSGLDYKLNDNNQLSLLYNFAYNKPFIHEESTTEILGANSLDSISFLDNRTSNHFNISTISLGLQSKIDSSKSTLNTYFDYVIANSGQESGYRTNTFNSNEDLLRSFSRQIDNLNKSRVYSFKADFSSKHKEVLDYEVGIKYSNVNTNNILNDFESEMITMESRFEYIEGIFASYINIRKTLFKDFSMQLGSRLESSNVKGSFNNSNNIDRNFTNLLPSIHLNYNAKLFSLNLSGSRRVTRPKFKELNPFVYFLDPYTRIEGNPNLQPQKTSNITLRTLYKKDYSFSLSFSRAKDVIGLYVREDTASKQIFISQKNLNSNSNYAFSFSAPFQVTKPLQVFFNSSFFYNAFNYYDVNSDESKENGLLSARFTLLNTYKISNFSSIELSGFYATKQTLGTVILKDLYSVDLSFNRQLFNKRLIIQASLNDIFNTGNARQIVTYGEESKTIDYNYDSRSLNLSLRYNFGNMKVKSKSPKNTASDEERQRIRQ